MDTKTGANTGSAQTGGVPKSAPAAAKVIKNRGTQAGTVGGKISKNGDVRSAPTLDGPIRPASVVEKMYRPPNILRLAGVKLSDFRPPEDLLDERLLEAVDSAEGRMSPLGAEGVPFDKIPPEFTGLEDWPMSTNLKCWVCDFNFSDRPKFVPLSFKENEIGGYKMGVHGVMCTFNCAELYIETHYQRFQERQHLQELLHFEYFFFTSKWVARVKPAPSKTEMIQYGGSLDSEAFLKKLRELDPEHGLRDHTPGSILPERLRANPSESQAQRSSVGDEEAKAKSPETPESVWSLCSVLPPSAAQRGDAGSVWQLLDPNETIPGKTNSETPPTKGKSEDGAGSGSEAPSGVLADHERTPSVLALSSPNTAAPIQVKTPKPRQPGEPGAKKLSAPAATKFTARTVDLGSSPSIGEGKAVKPADKSQGSKLPHTTPAETSGAVANKSILRSVADKTGPTMAASCSLPATEAVGTKNDNKGSAKVLNSDEAGDYLDELLG